MATRTLKALAVAILGVTVCVPLSVSNAGAAQAGERALASYAYRQQLTVTGGSDAVYGSTVTAVLPNAIDYVVKLHLAGAQAAAVYDHALYKPAHAPRGVPFADVTLWYTGGPTPQQIDYDYDPYTYGAWTKDNITLWFKLQALLGPAPAQDGHYVLAWRNRAPRVMRNWAHIYPLQDDFNGVSLNTGLWQMYNAGTISVGNGVATIASWSSWAGIYSGATYGVRYAVSSRIAMPPLPANQQINVGFGQPTNSAPYYEDADINVWSTTTWQARFGLGTPGSIDSHGSVGALDSAMHIYNVARDSSGNHYYWRDSEPVYFTDQSDSTSNLDVAAFTYSGAIAKLDWIKVRPWIVAEPSVAAGRMLAGR